MNKNNKSMADYSKQFENEILLNFQFKHITFNKIKNQYVATLIDKQEYEILKGFGDTVLDAINDLHSDLI
ncbi:hypothetical protein [Aquimarina sp. Aq78]|uniref:hypothetical protein n=1 Tax=Aquimarina sp. Aq78 TaxID=1191889 RepID=UPI000D0F5309|nr:hypothetical protein [Aquimarina sp. Aq78]